MDNTRLYAIVNVMEGLKEKRREQFRIERDAINEIASCERSIKDLRAAAEAAQARMDAIDVALNALIEAAKACSDEPDPMDGVELPEWYEEEEDDGDEG